ncbi:hypothetical protein PFICI_00740 [Pestalotiopsis fici W106-1]|uniref:Uncharacterized protein n=1 Tax=Pestalotiopsis fici (strain W106-1 / CGMCC3.15140) TaxID=1229662 RepID=W3XN23_PESFW|nr:uncharacterized protein PFICI_00740 [Pestalotiopsis fici W106-1]ETS86912.1 hypothetical protein PFICI_00740 [Pestalotiopsis fici W106-1]
MELVRNSVGINLLDGCCYEAERAERVAGSLEQLRQHLPPDMHAHLAGLITQIISTSHNLRDITDHSQVHMARVPWATDHLNILLPCLARTLRDIEGYYSNNGESRVNRWRRMYQEMGEELRGTPLPARFVLYNDYLNQLRFLLGRSPNYDPNSLIYMQRRILDLRRARDIREFLSVGRSDQRSHWAESIFQPEIPRKSRLERPKRSFGPWERFGQPFVSPNAKILTRCHFNNHQLSVTFILQDDDAPWLMIRIVNRQAHWLCLHGAHELCISRHDYATLYLSRWSRTEQRAKRWASLKFEFFEELVLFYNMFLCLKLKSSRMVDFHPKELALREEINMFTAFVEDDRTIYTLAIHRDVDTKRRRLQMTLCEGHLKGCPVWTAFLPGPGETPRSQWLKRGKSEHVILLKNLHAYVFCDGYSVPTTKLNADTFKIYFVNPIDADKFLTYF